jgi:hypothetical protein
MIIDCDTCDLQHTRTCEDCIVTALLGEDGILELAEEEKAAIDALSTVGLIAPIRLVGRRVGGGHARGGDVDGGQVLG